MHDGIHKNKIGTVHDGIHNNKIDGLIDNILTDIECPMHLYYACRVGIEKRFDLCQLVA